jgi:ribosomal protein L37AE/L43A
MERNRLRTGKQRRPKTAIKGQRYRCAKCRKRSPQPVKTPVPWYCEKCLAERAEEANGTRGA